VRFITRSLAVLVVTDSDLQDYPKSMICM